MGVGEITPQQCWQELQEYESSFLIDVRTPAEWTFVGVPDLKPIGKELICVEWNYSGSIKPQNPAQTFVDTVNHYLCDEGGDEEGEGRAEENKNSAALTPKASKEDSRLYFICRSGQRSMSAAQEMSKCGWAQCYNVQSGFEGPLDDNKQRATKAGWKVAALPWIQG